MRSYQDYRRILEYWEQGYSQKRIAKVTGILRATVRDCIKHYGSLAQLEHLLATGHMPVRNDNRENAERVYILPHYVPRRKLFTDEEFVEAVQQSASIAQVLEKLDLRVAGGNYEYVKKRIKELGLDTSHFRGKGWAKGQRQTTIVKRAMEEILVQNSTYMSTAHLRERLLKEGYFDHRCAECGLTEWRGQPIPLELDHINGDRTDNRLENLRLLCPNCHALTPNYRGKNIRVNGAAQMAGDQANPSVRRGLSGHAL